MKPKVNGYPRSNGGKFSNPKGGIPSITFDRELLCDFGGEQFTRQIESITVDMSDPAKLLPLLSPVDDSPIPIEAFIAKLQAQGGATYEDLYILQYSLYQQAEDEHFANQVA